MDRIERYPLQRGVYIGYANGPWRIRRNEYSEWNAFKSDGAAYLTARTLREMNDRLANFERHANG